MAAFSYDNFDFIMSIGFGTTYSGTCYAHTKRANTKNLDIFYVTDWPGQKGKKLKKVPTVCIYDRGTNELFKWGADAYRYWHDPTKPHENYKYVEKFKLNLQPTRTKGEQIILENDDGSLHVKATTDFLKAIYEYTFKEMKKTTIEKSTIDKSSILFILTVPAQWTDDDKKLMRLICIEAGIISEKDHENRMQIVSESLASVIYCEREMANEFNFEFEKGMRYLICDVGDRTVNLATYESTGKDPELRNFYNGHRQLTFDRSKDCGSVFVDQNMTKLLLEIIFAKEDERKQYGGKERNILGSILKHFIDDTKPNFNYTEEDDEALQRGDDDDQLLYFLFTSSDLRDFSKSTKSQSKYFGPDEFKTEFISIWEAIKEGYAIEYILLPKKLMKEKVFDPCIETTLKLIERYIARSNYDVSATFLLGDFGKSLYLQERLKKKTEDFKTGKVVTGDRSEAAAMAGALHLGIDFIRREEYNKCVKN